MKKLLDALEKICCLLVIIFGIALVFDVMLQIVGRYFFSQPVSWTEELSRYLLAGIVAFATPVVARRDQYIRVDVLLNRIPEKPRTLLKAFLDGITAVFLLVVAYHAISYVQIGKLQMSPVLRLPMEYVFASVLIGPALTAVFFAERSVNGFKQSLKGGKS